MKIALTFLLAFLLLPACDGSSETASPAFRYQSQALISSSPVPGHIAAYYDTASDVANGTPLYGVIVAYDPITNTGSLRAWDYSDNGYDALYGPNPRTFFQPFPTPVEFVTTPAVGKAIDVTGMEIGEVDSRLDVAEGSLIAAALELDDMDVRMGNVEQRSALGHGTVRIATGAGLALSANAWTKLVGGSISGPSSGISYSAAAGDVTLSPGTWRVTFHTTQTNTVALQAPAMDTAVYVDGTITDATCGFNLAALLDRRSCSSSIDVEVASSATVALYTRSSLSLTLGDGSYTLAVERL